MQANRFFNNSGPVNETDHFCVSPISRMDTRKVWQLILQKKYFLICGPKQCGKTSYLLALANVINHNKSAKCLYFNVESLRGVREDLEESIRSILFEISSRARDTFGDDYLEDLVTGILSKRGPYQALNELLTQWSKRSDRPIVLLIDEIDTLGSAILTSILSQIRAGYDKRPALFPLSIVFCATHDVIDKQFNIKDATLRISFLGRETLDGMFAAYTAKFGVEIDKAAVDRIWRYSAGQPWIISTLSGELFHEIVPAKGMRRVSADQVDESIGNIIEKRGNHLEYLVSRLRDERIKKCLIPILCSGPTPEDIAESEFAYVQELGLIRADRRLEISNGLYKEMIPSALFGPVTYMIRLHGGDFLLEDRSMDTVRLMRSFQSFFRNHIDRMVALIDYGIAGYFLVFEALLHKLADATNFISYEYGIDQGRVVLTLRRVYPEPQDVAFILKLSKVSSLEKYKQTLPQLHEEAKAFPGDFGDVHMVIINTNPKFDWEGKMPYVKKGDSARGLHFWGF